MVFEGFDRRRILVGGSETPQDDREEAEEEIWASGLQFEDPPPEEHHKDL